jgi:anti-sigma regulatory factor (Ser/Thr protein kinase)
VRRPLDIMDSLVTIQTTADPAMFPLLRKMAAAAARSFGASMLEAADVELSIGEALANVYLHAYGRRPGPVAITIDFDGAAMSLAVRDEGQGKPETIRVGRGLSLLQELTDGVDLVAAPDGHGAVLQITRRLG